MGDADLVPVNFKFVGENARKRRSDMLAQLGANDVDDGAAIAIDREPQGRLEQRA